MNFRGNQRENLHKALVDAIQSERELERLMLYGMDVPLWNVVQHGTREDIVFDLLRWVEAQGRLAEFIKVLRQNRPHHAQLRIVLDEIENVQTPEPSQRGQNHTGHDGGDAAKAGNMRSKQSLRRGITIFSGMLLLAVLLLFGVWLWNRENQGSNSKVNAPAPSPITNQSPIPNASPTSIATASENPSRAASSPTKPPAPKPHQVAQHIGNARSLYERGKYQSALRECDNALRLDPSNRDALNLKKKIQTTINILNR